MKNDTHLFIAFLSLLIGFGCDSKQSTIHSREAATVVTDTTQNLPFPAQGKMRDPDSLAEPITVPILHAPKTVPARNNVFIAEPPTPMPISGVPEIITPGKNGVPLPDTITMHQEVTLIKHPKPVVAGPLTMKPEAIADIQNLSISQGLKYPFVSSIMEDRRGNLWTRNGDYLSRYDGQHFIHYSAADFGSGDFFSSPMLEDRRGNLWLGGRGLSRYDGNHSTSYTFGDGQDDFTTISMLEDEEGKLWFGTYHGFFCYNPSANSSQVQVVQFSTEEGLIARRVYAMLQDRKGSLWLGTSLGLSRFDGRHFTNFPIEGKYNGVHAMIEDSEGMLWLGTNDGLIRFDPSANAGIGSFANVNIEVGAVSAFTEDDNGNIWVAGYSEGLFCLLRNEMGIGNSYLRYTQDEGLNGSYFLAMIKDSHGNIWIGGQNGGLSHINIKNPIRYYNQAIGLKGNLVDCIFEDSQGCLWFGLTNTAGALKYDAADGGTFTNYGTAEGLIDESVTSIMEDSQGSIWMGSWGNASGNGATRLNRSKRQFQSDPWHAGKESFTFFNTESGLLNQNVLSMFQDSKGNLWFGNGGGVTYYEPNFFNTGPGRFYQYMLESRTRHVVRCILEDRDGDIWISAAQRGVYKLDLNLSEKKMNAGKPEADKRLNWIEGKIVTNYTTKDGLSDNRIHDIIEDSHGMLWFASTNGLSRYNPTEQRFYTYGSEDGVLNDNLLSMAKDRQNNLWILSQSGMNVVVSDQINPADNSEGGDYQFFTFLTPDGFRTADSGFKNILVTRQNQLWWATGDGVASLDLNNFELPADAPKINLNSIEIEQTYLDFSGFQDTDYLKIAPLTEQLTGTFDSVAAFNNYPLNLALPYDINHLTFQFSAIDWISPHQLQYSYLMEGMSETWSDLSPEPKADYRNLAPGKYTFKVKAIGIAKKWSDVFEYSFVILPPWWQTWWAYAVYGLFFIAGVFVVDRFQRQRLAEKERQKSREKELEQAKEIEKAYHDLKVTQTQLIHSEKMASLGELTAGIAHEIQNPLNFVNNFSEVNTELIEEANQEIDKGNTSEVKELLKDIKENESKINHHGKRADSIIKGMLQHSRTSSGQKELTDINALCDEYLRLAYHGHRAKDKSFNATIKTDFDESLSADEAGIGNISIIPQDIGRVVLNLINNAFYVVDEKKRSGIENYEPTVSVSTNKAGDKVMIAVKDNGNGISQKVMDKIFQPFFTTKPTGQGTGLGLSLSYDIVVKGHGGTLEVVTEEGLGSAFQITLPIQKE